ncbi:hypothetical protein SADUNF_Sadunf02G0103900 [Salix dunnii]|uniref:Uncharacterized protein n=1 Tax=Salix dunnii TaxID=1413687 RepID=A0A835N7H4_9ROSI|nr:hypothetical protein SADUNF_Sadunf02G0103900 [Salix dunnii]
MMEESNDGGRCRGIEKLELWGAAVKWGSDHKFNSSEENITSYDHVTGTITSGPQLGRSFNQLKYWTRKSTWANTTDSCLVHD